MKHNPHIIICIPKPEPQEIVITGVPGEMVTKIILLAGHSGTYAIRMLLKEKNTEVQLLVMPLLWDHQSIDLNIIQHHAAADTASSVYVCGALAGNARTACCCATTIERGLKAVRTIQQSSFLMLSSMAKAKVVPAIATYSKEIVSQHGAAIGSFEPEHLRQLALKGIAKNQATALLLHGFVLQNLARFGVDCLPPQVEDAMLCLVQQSKAATNS